MFGYKKCLYCNVFLQIFEKIIRYFYLSALKVRNYMQSLVSFKNIIASILFLVSIYGFQTTNYQKEKPISGFSQKDYYKKIFTSREQKKLKSLRKSFAKVEKWQTKAEKYFLEADKQTRIAKVTQNQKTKSKAKKLQAKNLKKADKKYSTAFTLFFKSSNEMLKIYSQKYPKIQPKGDSAYYQYSQKLKDRAESLQDSTKQKINSSKKLPVKEKILSLKKAQKQQKEAIAWFETAFSALYGDPSLIISPNNSTRKTDISDLIVKKELVKKIPEHKKKERSNIITVNGSLYISNSDLILKNIHLSDLEKAQWAQSIKLQSQADSINDKVELLYGEIDRYRNQSDTAQTIKSREALKQKAAEIEGQSFLKLTSATKLYLQLNKIRYSIYKNHLSDLKYSNDAEKSKISLYTTEANTLFGIAETKEHLSSRLPYISDQYIKLMESNELELLALEKQEKAYLFHFAIPDKRETIIADKETELNTEEEQLEVQAEKPSAGKSKIYPRSYSYSMLKQSQVDVYALTSDFVYRVQVGAFKRFPSISLAKRYKIISKKLRYKDLKVYYAGDFKTFEAINYILDEVRAKGYKDAFIVCYVNTHLCSPAQAEKTIKSNKKLYTKYLDYAKYELPNLKKGKSYFALYPTLKKSTKPKHPPLVKKTNQKTSVRGTAFYVQLGAFSKSIVPKSLKKYEPLFVVKKTNGLYTYLKGPFDNYKQAKTKEAEIKKQGFKDAYIIAYKDSKEIALYKAIKLSTNTSSTKASYLNSKKVVYRLQIAAYKGEIPKNFQQKLKQIAKTKPVENFKQANGLTIYTVGYFTNYESALKAERELTKYKIKQSFVIAFIGDKRISLREAKKKSK